jgi:hypothetical protein
VAAVSPDSGTLVELFNPRLHLWEEHFTRVGAVIVGLSDIGRATVRLLDMNEDERVAIRAELQAEGLL